MTIHNTNLKFHNHNRRAVGALVLVGLAALLVPIAAATNPEPLYPVAANGAWGYIEATGKLVIPAQYDWAGFFAEGLALVRIDSHYGYIDRSGQLVIAAQYDDAWDFSEGRALVKLGRKFGYIDPSGARVVGLKYDEADGFSESLAAVKIGGAWGYIDRQGTLVIPAEFKTAAPFSNGLAAVALVSKFGYIDRQGKIVIPLQYEDAGNFAQGLAAVELEQKFGYIDPQGQMVIKPQFNAVRGFAEGLAAVNRGGEKSLFGVSGGQWGFINLQGELVIEPQFSLVRDFSGGLAAVNRGGKADFFGIPQGGQWGFIDRTGRQVIGFQFEQASQFEQGLAFVTVLEKMGYVDHRGRYLWEPESVVRQEQVDFAKPGTGFNEKPPWQVVNGELTFRGSDYFQHNFYLKKLYSDCQIGVRVQTNSPVSKAGFGLVFWAVDDANFHTFLIAADGSCRLSRLVNNQPQKLAESQKADLLKPGYNRLQVRCSGDLIQCSINEELVIEFRDSTLGSGYFYVGLGANPGLECSFDQFELTAL